MPRTSSTSRDVMEIVEKKISELVEYENNPRVSADAVKTVAESIKSFGWKQPIVIDKNNVIVAGHTRFRAAKRLKLKIVPCVIADDLTEDEVKAYRLIDNRSGEFSTWNLDRLVAELKIVDFNLDDWQFPSLFSDEIPTIPDVNIPKEINYEQKFGVVIDCLNEQEQKAAYEFVTGLGYPARIVSI